MLSLMTCDCCGHEMADVVTAIVDKEGPNAKIAVCHEVCVPEMHAWMVANPDLHPSERMSLKQEDERIDALYEELMRDMGQPVA